MGRPIIWLKKKYQWTETDSKSSQPELLKGEQLGYILKLIRIRKFK